MASQNKMNWKQLNSWDQNQILYTILFALLTLKVCLTCKLKEGYIDPHIIS